MSIAIRPDRSDADEYGITCPHCHAKPKGLHGLRTLQGWGHPRQSPAKPWANIYPDGAYMVGHRGWLDHLWRFRRPESGERVFVAEPYALTQRDLDDLALLRELGWRVDLRGNGFHHPDTIRVCLEREAKS